MTKTCKQSSTPLNGTGHRKGENVLAGVIRPLMGLLKHQSNLTLCFLLHSWQATGFTKRGSPLREPGGDSERCGCHWALQTTVHDADDAERVAATGPRRQQCMMRMVQRGCT